MVSTHLHRWRVTVAFVVFVAVALGGLWRLESTVSDVRDLGERLQAEAKARDIAVCEASRAAREARVDAILATVDFFQEQSPSPDPATYEAFRDGLATRLDVAIPTVECP